jgi:hypothetical protein
MQKWKKGRKRRKIECAEKQRKKDREAKNEIYRNKERMIEKQRKKDKETKKEW